MRSITCCLIANSQWRNGMLHAYYSIVSFTLRRVFPLAVAFLSTALLVQAHPGHDDGHELTWDFQHLGQSPWATLAWAVGFGLGLWGLSQLMRVVAERIVRSQLRTVRVSRNRRD